MTRQPNLLVAGFAKCGTTSLASYLATHPDIAIPPVKELYEFVDGQPLTDYREEIRASLSGFTDPSERYYMDATPFYYGQTSALELAKSQTDCKVIFITRNPVERLKSSFRFFCEMYQEYPASELSTFIDSLLSEEAGRNYRKEINKPFFRYIYDQELEMCRYANHIDRWASHLKPENILVLSMEHLKANPLDLMTTTCDFLGIDSQIFQDFEFKPYMQSYSVRNRTLQKKMRKLGGPDLMSYSSLQQYYNPFHFSKNAVIRRLGDALFRMFQRKTQPYLLSPRQHAALDKIFAEDNARLSERYGIDYSQRRAA